MISYTATIRWSRTGDGDFAKGQYSRAHEWAFDGGAVVPAGPSTHIVPEPWGNPAGVDPEEAFVASLSSCHMLFFVDFARRAGFVVDSYVDEAEGVMEKRADGRMWMSRVTLRPRIVWGDSAPDEASVAELHHKAHDACFIANSVRSEVVVENPTSSLRA
ncbi:OsmC family peroxiredoxin [Sphingomonas sinipercae]|uniref:OsmC family peroxiredoxin n=1 Tax=Sphingomonas sinipercae TaxID=2714944 RepID=A0A6G7ZLW1_9SPHN|nr:OsmC family protein [Sphingomonas sinipercae]QIL01915.1 OsmC family peroxiredoxin [Sphingomonas sinipercae]